MKKSSAEKWIASHSKKESPRMVLLIIGNALFSVCGVMTALYAKYIIDAAHSYFYRHFSRLFAKHLRRECRAKSR